MINVNFVLCNMDVFSGVLDVRLSVVICGYLFTRYLGLTKRHKKGGE
jgi:hypothetical protein